MGTLPDFLALTVDQPTIAQPTTQPADLVDQLVENPTIEERVVHPVIDPQPGASIISVGFGATLIEVVVDSAVAIPLSNLKTTTAAFILDEEV